MTRKTSNPKTQSESPEKLIDLLDSSQQAGEYFLKPTATNGNIADYVADFQSSDILDGWKYIGRRQWYHPLHQISSFLGRFPPALARYFICQFSQENEVVYDPFSGSGTVPLEACLLNRQAIGNDSFTYAYTLTHAKIRPPTREQFDKFVNGLKAQTEAYLPQVKVEQEPLRDDLEPYYHPETLKQILAVRHILNTQEYQEVNKDTALFVKAMISGILHGDSAMFLSVQTKDTWSASPRYVRKFVAEHKLKYEQRDVFGGLSRKAERVYRLPLPQKYGRMYNTDLTTAKMDLEDKSVDLIVTSPPYLSVRNYPLDNWLRVWFLGSERSVEKQSMLITQCVETYEQGMKQALTEMFRILKPNRVCVIVAANVVRGVKGSPVYYTCRELATIAKQIGFNIITIFNDDIEITRRTSQFFNQKRYQNMTDSVPHDSVLILSKGNCPIYPQNPILYSVEQKNQKTEQ